MVDNHRSVTERNQLVLTNAKIERFPWNCSYWPTRSTFDSQCVCRLTTVVNYLAEITVHSDAVGVAMKRDDYHQPKGAWAKDCRIAYSLASLAIQCSFLSKSNA